MKNKKGQTIYSEEIYFPCEFRTKHTGIYDIPPWVKTGKGIAGWINQMSYMPVLLTGWVQDEVHLQWNHQSLN